LDKIYKPNNTKGSAEADGEVIEAEDQPLENEERWYRGRTRFGRDHWPTECP
jgi:hypothetical protein